MVWFRAAGSHSGFGSPGMKEDAMPRSYRRLAVLTVVLVLALALVGPPAQAREASGLIDTLNAQVASWMAAWWPWSPSLKATAGSGHSMLPRASEARPVHGVAGGTVRGATRRPVVGPIKSADCVSPNSDPNGCPP
jgi:hypothetical protein